MAQGTQRQATRWQIEFARLMDWSLVDKALLLPIVLIPIYAQYLAWALYVLHREDRGLLVDAVFLEQQQAPAFFGFIIGALGLLALGLVLRRRAPNALWFQHLCALYYSLTLVYCGYIIGSLSFAAGVVLIGAPLMGFILLERAVVYLAWGIALVAVIAISYAGSIGLLQYAPSIVAPMPGDFTNQVFWTTSTLYFAAPHILFIVALSDFMLARWRERETAFRTLSLTDALTGAHNRRSVLDQLERELARSQRQGPPLSVLLVDLDHFKKTNDTWGHAVGDEVLKAAARALAESLREYDMVGRWGGEEFLILLPTAGPEQALALAERCRQRLAALRVPAANGEVVPVSGSIGLATNPPQRPLDAAALVHCADEALYRAKQNGRNRVEIALHDNLA